MKRGNWKTRKAYKRDMARRSNTLYSYSSVPNMSLPLASPGSVQAAVAQLMASMMSSRRPRGDL